MGQTLIVLGTLLRRETHKLAFTLLCVYLEMQSICTLTRKTTM